MPLPDVVTLPVSVSPAGNLDSGSLMLLSLLLTLPGSPLRLLLTRRRSIEFGPFDMTFQTAEPEILKPATLRWPLPFTSLLPTDTTFRPPPEPPPPPRNPSAVEMMPPTWPRLISTVPCSGPAVPDWKFEFRCTFC